MEAKADSDAFDVKEHDEILDEHDAEHNSDDEQPQPRDGGDLGTVHVLILLTNRVSQQGY